MQVKETGDGNATKHLKISFSKSNIVVTIK
jgi:hypothetical protein